jgi:hypothetical protein
MLYFTPIDQNQDYVVENCVNIFQDFVFDEYIVEEDVQSYISPFTKISRSNKPIYDRYET